MRIDDAHDKTDKILADIESEIRLSYARDDALKRAGKKYRAYMLNVDRKLKRYHDAYVNADSREEKEKKKREYMEQADMLTRGSFEYQRIIDDYTTALAVANQNALDIVNSRLAEIYVLNYNQVAVECERVGIEVKDGGK